MRTTLSTLLLVLVFMMPACQAFAAFPIASTEQVAVRPPGVQSSLKSFGASAVATPTPSPGILFNNDFEKSVPSFVCSLIFMFPLAIYYGIAALVNDDSLKGFAIAGLTLGVLELLLFILFFVVITL